MTHLLTHGVQDFGCRYTVGMQSCTMRLYGERGVSRMGYVKLVASIILIAGMSTGSVLTDSQLTMVAILLAGFIAHGEE